MMSFTLATKVSVVTFYGIDSLDPHLYQTELGKIGSGVALLPML